MTQPSPSDLSWAVVDNGLDFLNRSVAELSQDPPDVKYAAIHLFSAIEVLIKARLIHEHWTLACRSADKASLGGLLAGEVFTVDPMKGLDRLRDSVGISITKEQYEQVDAVRRLRNRLAHFAAPHGEPAAKLADLGKGLSFAFSFLVEQVNPNAHLTEVEAIEDTVEQISHGLAKIDSFVAARMTVIESLLHAAALLVECPQCLQGTLEINEDTVACHFCSWSTQGETAADAYVEMVLHTSSYDVFSNGGDWPLSNCPECGSEAFVAGATRYEYPNSDLKSVAVGHELLVCFSCSYSVELDAMEHCRSCTIWIPCGTGMCSECFANLLD